MVISDYYIVKVILKMLKILPEQSFRFEEKFISLIVYKVASIWVPESLLSC